MTGPACLFDGRDVQLLHFPGDGRAGYRLVSFDIMHARANRKTAFAAGFALKNGVELFGIVPKYPCWYPSDETAQACRIIAAREGPLALAYGSSMGGYGALRYGRLAGCKAVLAFSPQATIDPAVTGQADPRYARFHDAARHSDMAVMPDHLCDHNFVIHDPKSKLDALQAALLPPVHHLVLNHVGHRSVSVIASSGVATEAFKLALAGQGAALGHLLRQGKKTASSYLAGLAQAGFAARHYGWASAIATRGLEKYPQDKDLALVAALAHGKQGQTAQAVPILNRIIAGYPHVLKYRLALMQVLAEAGDLDGAVTTLQAALARQDRFDLHLKLIRLLRQSRRWPEVQAQIAQAAEKWPDRRAELDRLGGRAAIPDPAQTRVDVGTRPGL